MIPIARHRSIVCHEIFAPTNLRSESRKYVCPDYSSLESIIETEPVVSLASIACLIERNYYFYLPLPSPSTLT